MSSTPRQELRQQLRQQRRRIPATDRIHYSYAICQHIIRDRNYRCARHIALYMANDAEVDVSYLIRHAWSQRKQVYLPVLGFRHSRRLWFVPYQPGDILYWNRFGIAEPLHANHERYQPPRRLDLIILPLVGFDRHGHRLGMGGGFYDTSLAHRSHTPAWRRPRCLGVAYSLQQVDSLESQPWDVSLDAIATEHGIQRFD